jgi:hypothetical protein
MFHHPDSRIVSRAGRQGRGDARMNPPSTHVTTTSVISVPAGCTRARVIVCAASAGQVCVMMCAGAQPGNSGTVASKLLKDLKPGQQLTVTIGAGGQGFGATGGTTIIASQGQTLCSLAGANANTAVNMDLVWTFSAYAAVLGNSGTNTVIGAGRVLFEWC